MPERSKKRGRNERDLVKKNPARPAPTFSIIPTDREPETGYYPSGWDASPSQGYLTILNLPVLIYPPEWEEVLGELSVLLKNKIKYSQPGLEATLFEIEKKYKIQRTVCSHRQLINLKMDNNEL